LTLTVNISAAMKPSNAATIGFGVQCHSMFEPTTAKKIKP